MGKKEEMMRKIAMLILLSAFLFGCGTAATQSEFWQHDSMYKSWSHARYSWTGYQNPSADTGKKSLEEGWWGIEIPYVPGR